MSPSICIKEDNHLLAELRIIRVTSKPVVGPAFMRSVQNLQPFGGWQAIPVNGTCNCLKWSPVWLFLHEQLAMLFKKSHMQPDGLLIVHETVNPNRITSTLEPPYYAVIFTSLRTDGDLGYGKMADRMVELAAQQPGFLGVESARTADGLGITVSYWSSEEAIASWKAHADHKTAQEAGQRVWYSDYRLRVARVEREYGKGQNQ